MDADGLTNIEAHGANPLGAANEPSKGSSMSQLRMSEERGRLKQHKTLRPPNSSYYGTAASPAALRAEKKTPSLFDTNSAVSWRKVRASFSPPGSPTHAKRPF
ncbi:MAG: hypothetical protein ACKOAL_01400, partial [Chthoniobacterales bacterium]